MTLNEIKQAMINNGSTWWTKGSGYYVGREIHPKSFCGSGGIYIVTSEQPYGSFRYSTVRKYVPEEKCLRIMGTFCAMNHEDALKLAKKLATGKVPWEEWAWADYRFKQE